jgi:hypothetical protein
MIFAVTIEDEDDADEAVGEFLQGFECKMEAVDL